MTGAGAALVIAIMVIGSIILWAGTPLAWLWIGAQVQGATQSLGTALLTAFAGVIVSILLLASLLARLSDLYRANCVAPGARRPRARGARGRARRQCRDLAGGLHDLVLAVRRRRTRTGRRPDLNRRGGRSRRLRPRRAPGRDGACCRLRPRRAPGRDGARSRLHAWRSGDRHLISPAITGTASPRGGRSESASRCFCRSVSVPIGLVSVMLLRARNLRHRVVPSDAGSSTGHPPTELSAAFGGSRRTSAAETSPAAMRRFNAARSSLISLARSSARKRCGSEVFGAVSVIGRSHFPGLPAYAGVGVYRVRGCWQHIASGLDRLVAELFSVRLFVMGPRPVLPARQPRRRRPTDHVTTSLNLEHRVGHSNVTSR